MRDEKGFLEPPGKTPDHATMLRDMEVGDLDVDKMLAELRLEREQIEEAILTLERLARGRGRRRGRPPAWLKDAAASLDEPGSGENTEVSPEHRRRGRPPGSKSKLTAQAAEA